MNNNSRRESNLFTALGAANLIAFKKEDEELVEGEKEESEKSEKPVTGGRGCSEAEQSSGQ